MSATDTGAGRSRGRIWAEIVIVLMLSLGLSAIDAVVNIVDRLTQPVVLSQQTATINAPMADRSGFDLAYQLISIASELAPVALVCYLLWRQQRPHLGALGFDFRRPWRDSGSGLLLALVIGIPGLALYVVGRAIGINVTLDVSALNTYWWTVPILILSAIRAALQEEFIMIGYLFERLSRVGWRPWGIILGSALVRGSYHLYQGFGGFAGNAIMGVIFGTLFLRWRRATQMIIAHTLIDAVAFIGYALLVGHVSWLV